MAADDGLVLAPRDNGIDEAELADGARERVQLGVGDAAEGWLDRAAGRRSGCGRRRVCVQWIASRMASLIWEVPVIGDSSDYNVFRFA